MNVHGGQFGGISGEGGMLEQEESTKIETWKGSVTATVTLQRHLH